MLTNKKELTGQTKKRTLMINGFLFKKMGLPSGYKGTWKFLNAILLSMHGYAYLSHFRNLNEMTKRFITSKVIGKINDMHSAYCIFNKMRNFF